MAYTVDILEPYRALSASEFVIGGPGRTGEPVYRHADIVEVPTMREVLRKVNALPAGWVLDCWKDGKLRASWQHSAWGLHRLA